MFLSLVIKIFTLVIIAGQTLCRLISDGLSQRTNMEIFMQNIQVENKRSNIVFFRRIGSYLQLLMNVLGKPNFCSSSVNLHFVNTVGWTCPTHSNTHTNAYFMLCKITGTFRSFVTNANDNMFNM